MILWSKWLIFMSLGGGILWVLFAVSLCLWCVVLERWWYLQVEWRHVQKKWLFSWLFRENHHSWCSQTLKESWLAEGRLRLFSKLRLIKLLTVLCPMLGLLGTVTGMILVFDELAREQSSISQLSESIAMATFPTLVGMVVSIVGIMAFSRLTRLSQKKMTLLEKELRSR